MKYTLTAVAASGDTAAMELIARGTNKGDLPGPAGLIRATKRTIELRMAAFQRINDQGLITKSDAIMMWRGLCCNSDKWLHED